MLDSMSDSLRITPLCPKGLVLLHVVPPELGTPRGLSRGLRGKRRAAIKKLQSSWTAKQLVHCCCGASRTSTITVLPVTTHKDGLRFVRQNRSLELVGDRDLRCPNFLCPAPFHIIAVPLPLVYKKLGHSPSQYSSPLQSPILRGRALHSLSITDPAAILRSFIHSLLRCSPSPSPLP